MATQTYNHAVHAPVVRRRNLTITRDDHKIFDQAYYALHAAFVAVPIVAGVDKFFYFLTGWDQYLAPVIPRITGIDALTFMLFAGVVEIIAGIGVALKPNIFGYVVAAWLAGIIVNLLMVGGYYDIILRDVVLFLGAFALARLASVHTHLMPRH